MLIYNVGNYKFEDQCLISIFQVFHAILTGIEFIRWSASDGDQWLIYRFTTPKFCLSIF